MRCEQRCYVIVSQLSFIDFVRYCRLSAIQLENTALSIASICPSAVRHSKPGPQSQSPQCSELPQRQVGC